MEPPLAHDARHRGCSAGRHQAQSRPPPHLEDAPPERAGVGGICGRHDAGAHAPGGRHRRRVAAGTAQETLAVDKINRDVADDGESRPAAAAGGGKRQYAAATLQPPPQHPALGLGSPRAPPPGLQPQGAARCGHSEQDARRHSPGDHSPSCPGLSRRRLDVAWSVESLWRPRARAPGGGEPLRERPVSATPLSSAAARAAPVRPPGTQGWSIGSTGKRGSNRPRPHQPMRAQRARRRRPLRPALLPRRLCASLHRATKVQASLTKVLCIA